MTKNKKTLKYLSVQGLHVGHSHLVWQNLRTVSAVRKGVIKARFLTGVYLLHSNRHIFSNNTIDPNYVNWRWRILVMSSLDVQPTM